ncbi:MAG: multicopper oxidase domain-containing protein [Ilumatobacteraceae bacterium]
MVLARVEVDALWSITIDRTPREGTLTTQRPTTPRLTRRRVLQAGVGAGALVALPGLLSACDDGDSGDASDETNRTDPTTPSTTDARPPIDGDPVEFRQPEVMTSQNGELAIQLRCTPADVEIAGAGVVSTWAYNGMVPAQTWELRPGDTLRVDLTNELPELVDPPPVDMTRPHNWSTTNLHTHGLHVSPLDNGDNVFLSIPPGGEQDYEIAIPEDHTGGLFWYHPHHHGGVCQQVRAGMAGALIIRGELDEVPEVAAATEQVMVLQAIEVDDDLALMDPIPAPTTEQAFFPRQQILYTVNGAMNPTIRMYPGEVQRWRLLNAAEGKFMSLQLDDHDFHVLAWDGLTLAEPDVTYGVMLSASNRVDLLVQAGEPGTYELMLTPGSSQKPNIPGMPGGRYVAPPHDGDTSNAELVTRSILTLEVIDPGEEREPMALPTSLPAYDPPILPIARRRTVRYTVERDGDLEFMSFGIDGDPFDPDRTPYRPQLGTAEEWTIVNDLDDKLDNHAHVFHIHVNPFKVTWINGEKLDTPRWRDSFVLTGKNGDSFTFETNFDDFSGKFVEHCHVLSHEDLGMMEAIEVVDPADPPDDPAVDDPTFDDTGGSVDTHNH